MIESKLRKDRMCSAGRAVAGERRQAEQVMPAIAGIGLTIFHQGARMVRFLHTSDWQLGMRRHFLDEGAQERYAQARPHETLAEIRDNYQS